MNTSSESETKKSLTMMDNMQFPRLYPFFQRYQHFFFYASLFFLLLFGILLFDVRISEGGDDSSYLFEAMKFSKGKSFPGFHGMFYSIWLGWLIRIIGFHLIFFKALSLVFLLAHQTLFYLTFRNRVSPFLLSVVLLITSISSGILYFGSQTYTEAFFMMLQGLLFFIFIVFLADSPNNSKHIKTKWYYYLLLGFVLFMMSTTRNIGLVAIVAILVFYIIDRKYFPALYSLSGYLIFSISFSLYKKLVWNVKGAGFTSQLYALLQKDPYDASLGYENFSGLIKRLFVNTRIYLSDLFLSEIGFLKSSHLNISFILTLAIVLLLVTGLIFTFTTKNSVFRISFIYIGLALGVSFITLSQFWSQSRVIIIFIPIILLGIGYTFGELSSQFNQKWLRALAVILLAISFLVNFTHSVQKTKKTSKILKQYLAGNKYYGYTPDYRNFLALSEWTAKNVPEEVNIASRKASMSFIYGNGRYFFPLNKVPYENTENFFQSLDTNLYQTYFFNSYELMGKEKTANLQLNSYLEAYILVKDDVFDLYLVEKKNRVGIDTFIDKLSIKPITSIDEFRKMNLAESNQSSTLIPDKLLDLLYKNNIHYLINASLRVVKDKKTGRIIDTIDRFIAPIHNKYPGSLQFVKQFGKNNDEPARLIRVDFKYCEQKGWVYSSN